MICMYVNLHLSIYSSIRLSVYPSVRLSTYIYLLYIHYVYTYTVNVNVNIYICIRIHIWLWIKSRSLKKTTTTIHKIYAIMCDTGGDTEESLFRWGHDEPPGNLRAENQNELYLGLWTRQFFVYVSRHGKSRLQWYVTTSKINFHLVSLWFQVQVKPWRNSPTNSGITEWLLWTLLLMKTTS